jgi:hypothetical protein
LRTFSPDLSILEGEGSPFLLFLTCLVTCQLYNVLHKFMLGVGTNISSSITIFEVKTWFEIPCSQLIFPKW